MEYMDSEGNVHGPFSRKQLVSWRENELIPGNWPIMHTKTKMSALLKKRELRGGKLIENTSEWYYCRDMAMHGPFSLVQLSHWSSLCEFIEQYVYKCDEINNI